MESQCQTMQWTLFFILTPRPLTAQKKLEKNINRNLCFAKKSINLKLVNKYFTLTGWCALCIFWIYHVYAKYEHVCMFSIYLIAHMFMLMLVLSCCVVQNVSTLTATSFFYLIFTDNFSHQIRDICWLIIYRGLLLSYEPSSLHLTHSQCRKVKLPTIISIHFFCRHRCRCRSRCQPIHCTSLGTCNIFYALSEKYQRQSNVYIVFSCCCCCCRYCWLHL